MNCRQFRNWMKKDPSTWLVDAVRALEAHRRSCESCRTLWNHLTCFEDTVRECRGLRIPDAVDTGLWPQVFSRITASPAKTGKAFRPRFKPVLAWSFSTVAAACLIWLLAGRPRASESGPDLTVDAATINGSDAQIITFQFEDPKLSIIWMQ